MIEACFSLHKTISTNNGLFLGKVISILFMLDTMAVKI